MCPGMDAEGVERYLAGLEPIGWRLGVERMQALCEVLGEPQKEYLTIHVVGTNGKTSVTRMTEALLTEAGVRAGASVSPHLRRWIERISVGGRQIPEPDFVAAANRVAEAASQVEGLTQFEIATAIAFVALADAGVEAAVIEAGLGGRLDASNVLDSCLTVLTSVGLDHTEWLGATPEQIAVEKLAVLQAGTALLLGPVDEGVRELARGIAAERAAELIELDRTATDRVVPGSGPDRPELVGTFRRLDLELARQASIFALQKLRPEEAERLRRSPDSAAGVLGDLELPGRLERIEASPPVILDVAHNPDGAAALAEALAEITRDRPVVACIAMLSDKDHHGFAAALGPGVSHAFCCEIPAGSLRGSGRPGAESRPADEVAEAFRRVGVQAGAVPGLGAALEQARRRALDVGGVLLVAGSHYLVAIARDRLL